MTTVLASSCIPDFVGGHPGWLVLEDEHVVHDGIGPPPAGTTLVGNAVLAPGFVDLQVNGIGDVDFATAEGEAWTRAGRALLAHGVTSYLPTLVTAPLDAYRVMLERIARARADAAGRDLPAIEGVHLEGPFLGGAPGAHPAELIRPADPGWLSELLDAFPGLVRMVTIAPEADPGLATIRMLAERGVVVALGHTTCTYEEALAAADAGATLVTHLYNGMAPFHHRAPGLVGAVLANLDLTPTVIADLVHVHAGALAAAFAANQPVLVSDAVGLGASTVGGLAIEERDGAARRPDGTLVGSTLALDQAVRNVIAVGVDTPTAILSASREPAEEIHLDTYGGIGVGGRADLVALDPYTVEVRAVWRAGRLAYGELP